MTANRYRSTASRPASAGASLIVIAVIGTGMMFVGPKIVPDVFGPALITRHIPLTQPPPPEPEPKPTTEKRVEQRTTPPLHQLDPIVRTLPTPPGPVTTSDPVRITLDPPVGPTGLGGGITLDPPRAPVLVGAAVDPRHADALQPPYPSSELRAETEGNVALRVLIGVDGRVKAIEILRSPSEGLANATRRHALARWRFKPATRDGIPVESWKAMTLRFQIVE